MKRRGAAMAKPTLHAQVWTWVASDVVFKNDTASLMDINVKEVRADKVKIVCVDARVAQT